MIDKKTEKPIEYFLYDVKVQCTIPAEMTFKIRATSPEEALKGFDKTHPVQFTPHIGKRKIKRAVVFSSGSLMVKATKNY